MPNLAAPQQNPPRSGTYMNYDTRIGNGALPRGIQGSGNRAYTRDVQNPELAQNQLLNITNQASPLMRAAEAQGLRRANDRGMLNSSMSSESAQNAVISNAMPMALQDAQAYQQAAGENLQYLNQRDIANMNDRTQNNSINAGIEQTRMGNEGQLQRQRENLAYSGEQEELARRYGFNMAGLQNEFGTQSDYRNYGFDLGRAEQGYGFDLGRMGAQFGYNQQGADIDMRRQVYADQYTRTQDYFDSLMNNGMQNPDVFNPQVISDLYSMYNRFMTVGNPAIDNILGIGG